MLRVLMPSFGAHVFDVAPDESAPALHLPLVVVTRRGLDFDFTSLLLFDRVILDELSVEFVQFSNLTAHDALRESIARLTDAGIAEIRDFGAIAAEHRKELSLMDESEVQTSAVGMAPPKGRFGSGKTRAKS